MLSINLLSIWIMAIICDHKWIEFFDLNCDFKNGTMSETCSPNRSSRAHTVKHYRIALYLLFVLNVLQKEWFVGLTFPLTFEDLSIYDHNIAGQRSHQPIQRHTLSEWNPSIWYVCHTENVVEWHTVVFRSHHTHQWHTLFFLFVQVSARRRWCAHKAKDKAIANVQKRPSHFNTQQRKHHSNWIDGNFANDKYGTLDAVAVDLKPNEIEFMVKKRHT